MPLEMKRCKSPEPCLHGTGNRVAEGEVLLLRSADGVFLAKMADADGGVIGGHGNIPIMVWVMVDLKMGS